MTISHRFATLALLALSSACGRGSSVDLDNVPVGAEVAVTRQDGGVVQGKLAERDATTVKVGTGRTARTVPREQIADVQLVTEATPVVLPPVARFREYTLPEGKELHLRLDTAVNSATSKVEDAVAGTVIDAVSMDDTTVIPSGSTLKGDITSVEQSGKVKGRASLAMRFRTLVIPGHDAPYDVVLGMSRIAPSNKGKDTGTIVAPAVVGGIIGGILGGKKGALTGIVIGGGAGTAVVLTTAGPDIVLPAGTELHLRLDKPLDIRVPLGKGVDR